MFSDEIAGILTYPLIAEDLDHVEPGLTLIGWQYPALPVGRIDLLCRDTKGDIVVIEIRNSGPPPIRSSIRSLGIWVGHGTTSPRPVSKSEASSL
jgi:hypothetical protein